MLKESREDIKRLYASEDVQSSGAWNGISGALL